MIDHPHPDPALRTVLMPFDFEGNTLRAITRDGAPWFVLADVSRALEIGNARDIPNRLDEDEKGVDIIDTLGGPQEMAIINESGLYTLILTSRKAAAKRFKKWVTAEVLPAIRKTGRYDPAASGSSPPPPPLDPLMRATVASVIPMLRFMTEDEILGGVTKSPFQMTDTEAAFILMLRSTLHRVHRQELDQHMTAGLRQDDRGGEE